MLKNFFAAISNFFSSLFGSRKPTPPAPAPKPDTENGKLPDLVEDSSDVPQDTVITVNVIEVDVTGPFADDDKTDAIDKEEPTVVVVVPPVEPPPTPPTPTDTGKPKPTTPSHKARYLWCLDNGHGKLQPGKRSPLFDDGKTRFFEYEFNRDIVERIMKALDKKGVQYFDIVPDFLEVGSFLEERVDRANKKKSDLPKIYVSVHANAGPAANAETWVASSIKGAETWFAQNSAKGKKIAAVFQKHIVDKTGMKNRNLKSTAEKPLYVLQKTIMPAILTENGFYNNKEEVMDLMKDDFRQKIADAHVDAILEIEKNGIV
jgi:N-acetylmuramoyl-L-alanine amidase